MATPRGDRPERYQAKPDGRGASRLMREVASGVGLSEADTRRLLETVPNLLWARTLDAEGLAKAVGLDLATLARVREIARLTALPGITVATAVRLVEAGLDLEAIARGEAARVEAIVQAGGPEAAIPSEMVGEWMPAAARLIRLDAPGRVGPVRPPPKLPPRPAPVQRLTVDETADFRVLAGKYYDLRNANVETVIQALANANARRPEEAVDAGTRLVLPALPGAPRRPTERAAEEISHFAAFLGQEDAVKLVQAGFTSAASLTHLDPERDARGAGVAEETVRRLQLQSTLSRAASIPPEVAHALAAVSDYENAVEVAQASPAIVRRHLMRAAGVGYLDPTAIPDEATLARWLADLAGVVGTIDPGWLQPADPICPPAQAPTGSPENFYSYRLTPVGRSATALTSEREDRLRLFNKLGEALLDPAVQADSPAGRDKATQLER